MDGLSWKNPVKIHDLGGTIIFGNTQMVPVPPSTAKQHMLCALLGHDLHS